VPLRIMGFTPSWVHNDDEDSSVDGKRFANFSSATINVNNGLNMNLLIDIDVCKNVRQ